MNLSTQAEILLLKRLPAVGCCKLVEEVFVTFGVGNGEVVDPNDCKKKQAVAFESEDAGFALELRKAVVLEKLGVGLLPEMPLLAYTFKCHLQLANELLSCHLVVLFKAFHLLTVNVGIVEHCSRECLAEVDAFRFKVEERNERNDDADGCRLSSCREGLVQMNSRSLIVAAEDPAHFASFEGAVVVDLVGENPLGLAEAYVSVLGALDKVKCVVCYFALELFGTRCAPLFFVRAAVDVLVVPG
eukprot:145882-Pleurochrysis_carterae.AAC.4